MKPSHPPLLSALATWLAVGAAAHAAEEFAFYHDNVMGTSMELRVRADDEAAANRAEGRALQEIARLSAILSGYDPSSEFRRWEASSGEPVRVAPELFEVLSAADTWRERSAGAFDPRVAVLSRLWTQGAQQGRAPTPNELAAARALLNRDAWQLSDTTGTARRLSNDPLSLDGIAKGYIVENACAAALGAEPGVRGVLLNVGGDIHATGDEPWTIGLAPPRGDSESAEPFAFLEVRDRSVATSGDAHRGWSIAGQWYSHILNPRTGLPVEHTIAATVVAPRGIDADALATAFNVLTVEESLRLAGSLDGVECLLVASDGRVFRTAGWEQLEAPPEPLPTLASRRGVIEVAANVADTSAPVSWGEEFELAVHFETNRPDVGSGPYRRPYVVVFVEDEDGLSVRTVSLWVSQGGAGPDQWLPDLRRWYRGDAKRSIVAKKNMVFSIGRPTRPPGRYTVVWDGKDDTGAFVPPGTYTIFVEAAREHGTHQIIRKQVTLSDEPFAERLEGNVEIRSAEFEYRRKPASR